MDIDDKIRASWLKGKVAFEHRDDPSFVFIDPQESQEPREVPEHQNSQTRQGPEFTPQTTETSKLQQLIAIQPNNNELQQELKEIMMKWYWDGFYKGYSVNR